MPRRWNCADAPPLAQLTATAAAVVTLCLTSQLAPLGELSCVCQPSKYCRLAEVAVPRGAARLVQPPQQRSRGAAMQPRHGLRTL